LGKYDFQDAINYIKKELKIKHFHCHFSCIEFIEKEDGGYEKRHLPWEAKSPDLSKVAAIVKKEKIGFTLISESPELERDALKMKKAIFG
jgi:deoxyribonuclease-4